MTRGTVRPVGATSVRRVGGMRNPTWVSGPHPLSGPAPSRHGRDQDAVSMRHAAAGPRSGPVAAPDRPVGKHPAQNVRPHAPVDQEG
jgi:hypothetical protein